MELKEYYKIWREHISVVIYAVLIFVVLAYAWSVRKSETYSASLLLNISRIEAQQTQDYKYDQFYRLEADEKFAQTLTAWLKSPGVVRDILEKADQSTESFSLRQLSKMIQAEKLSSQAVSVKFASPSEEEAKKISSAIAAVVSEKTSRLNSEARDQNWFKVDVTNFIVLKNTQDLRINLALAALIGFLAGTFLSFGKHYVSE